MLSLSRAHWPAELRPPGGPRCLGRGLLPPPQGGPWAPTLPTPIFCPRLQDAEVCELPGPAPQPCTISTMSPQQKDPYSL